ncbi:MAG TPA: DUF6036 family nucleotidyltransferase [Solirubrobacteraceae bacterium]|jgi:hypothetical protein
MTEPAPAQNELDPERIFAALDAHEVEYIVIGGIAVQVHGHVRMTNDVDLIPSPDPANLGRLAAALNALDARILNPGSEHLSIDAAMLPRATLWQMTTRCGDIDILHEAPGAAPYPQLRDRALVVTLGDLAIQFAGRDDLIRMKRARGRPVDLADVVALTEIDHSE